MARLPEAARVDAHAGQPGTQFTQTARSGRFVSFNPGALDVFCESSPEAGFAGDGGGCSLWRSDGGWR
jgi:hypothetical protein